MASAATNGAEIRIERKDETMTKKTVRASLLLLMVVCLLPMTTKSFQGDQSIQTFWVKFKAAVIKGDKAAVAQMSKFPIEMQYRVRSVKTAAQLNKRYREVFNGETNAAKCFAEAKPEVDQSRPGFSVACKNEAGDPVIIYSFGRSRNGWRFTGLDNINE